MRLTKLTVDTSQQCHLLPTLERSCLKELVTPLIGTTRTETLCHVSEIRELLIQLAILTRSLVREWVAICRIKDCNKVALNSLRLVCDDLILITKATWILRVSKDKAKTKIISMKYFLHLHVQIAIAKTINLRVTSVN